MHAYPETIVCKFGGDPAFCLRKEAICAKVYRQTDDGRHAIALDHYWNELKTTQTRAVLSPGNRTKFVRFPGDSSHSTALVCYEAV